VIRAALHATDVLETTDPVRKLNAPGSLPATSPPNRIAFGAAFSRVSNTNRGISVDAMTEETWPIAGLTIGAAIAPKMLVMPVVIVSSDSEKFPAGSRYRTGLALA
jgi:hypothetical protein